MKDSEVMKSLKIIEKNDKKIDLLKDLVDDPISDRDIAFLNSANSTQAKTICNYLIRNYGLEYKEVIIKDEDDYFDGEA